MIDFFQVLLWSVISLIVLFLMSKLMGNKQISQMNAFDYITGISIGSIAAELAAVQDVDKPLNNVLAIVIYGLAAYLISFYSSKSIPFRKIITGRPIIIMENDCIFRKNMQKARIDIDDLLTLCREQGYFDISQIKTAFIEHDGKLSILPKSQYRPLTPSDMNLSVQPEGVLTVVMIEGKILHANLKLTNHDENWLIAALKKQNMKPEDVFVAFCDDNDNVSSYKIINEKVEVDRFE